MRKALVFVVALVWGALVAYAGTEQSSVRFAKGRNIFSYPPVPKSTPTLAIDSRYNRAIALRPAEMSALVFSPEKTLVISEFPVGVTDYATVQLHRTSQVADDQTLWLFNNKLRPAPKAVMYSGFIQNETGSKVRMCMINGRIYGLITHASGETVAIAPNDDYNSLSAEHTLASDKDPRFAEIGKNFHCFTDDVAVYDPNAQNKPFAMPTSTNLLEVEVGVEVDAPVFTKFLNSNGGDEDKAYEATQAYIYALFAMSSSIYEDEINVMLTLPFVKMWTYITDPGYPQYNTFGGDVTAILEKASNDWSSVNNKSGQYKRDLLHVCTSGATGTAGGVAYTGNSGYSGTICLQSNGYGVSSLYVDAKLPVVAYTWDVMVISHEMGHNFRSPHTHNCQGNVWPNNKPLDTCVTRPSVGDGCYSSTVTPRLPKDKGTIMSYCHLLSTNNGSVLEFRTIAAAVIRDGAERGVTRGCISEPANPVIKLQYPLGNNTVKGGDRDTIRWTSAKVNTVRVQFSDNNGQSWVQIGSDVSAGIRIMPWLIPAKASSQYLVRVIDPMNPTIGDSSWVAFTVVAPSVALQYPAGGERIGQREKPSITWASQLINGVKVEFSSNGGVGWQILSPSTTTNSYTWDVPDIETSNALIRVTALSDGAIVSQSKPFAIGKEKLQITNRENLIGLCRKKTGKIEWTSDFISSSAVVHIGISTNGGSTWTRLTNTLGRNIASVVFDTWTIPDVSSDNVRLRVYRRDDELVADTADATIIDCSVVISVNESWGITGKPIMDVTPNPAHDEISVKLALVSGCDNAEFYLTDTRGQKVVSLGTFDNLIVGEHSLPFDISTVAQGAYFLTLQSGKRTVTMPISIVR